MTSASVTLSVSEAISRTTVHMTVTHNVVRSCGVLGTTVISSVGNKRSPLTLQDQNISKISVVIVSQCSLH